MSIPFKRRLGAFWECAYPWLLVALAGFGLWYWNPPTARVALAIERLLTGTIDAAAVLVGFQTTALTLLLSIADKPIVRRLRENNFFNPLIAFHWQAIISLLLWLMASLILLAAQGATLDASGRASDLGHFTRWSAILLMVLMVCGVSAAFRVMKLLVSVLRRSV